MCIDPITAAALTAAVSVVREGAGAIAQQKTARAQTRAIRAQREVVQEENRKAATAELFDQMRAARRDAGRIRAAAGEAGLDLSSGSIEGLLMDTAMQMELQGDRTLANLESRRRATDAEASSMLSQVQRPTALGVGLNMAAAAAGGYADVSKAKLQVRGRT